MWGDWCCLQTIESLEGIQAANSQSMRHIEVSSKSGSMVEEAFKLLAQDIFIRRENDLIDEKNRQREKRRRSSAIGF